MTVKAIAYVAMNDSALGGSSTQDTAVLSVQYQIKAANGNEFSGSIEPVLQVVGGDSWRHATRDLLASTALAEHNVEVTRVIFSDFTVLDV